MNDTLLLSVIGPDQPGIVGRLAAAINARNLSIEDSRMAVLGGEFALIMLVRGSAQALAELEAPFRETCAALDLAVHLRGPADRTASAEVGAESAGIAYAVEVISMDHPGIVADVTAWWAERRANIEAMETTTYNAPITGAPMFRLSMTVVPVAAGAPGQLKADFVEFCDAQGLDAAIEPAR